MKKYIITIILLAIFFFLPAIPSQFVYLTKSQKEEAGIFCESHGCGLLSIITPYEYVKDSLHNAFASSSKNENCGVVGCYSTDSKGRTLLNGEPFGWSE